MGGTVVPAQSMAGTLVPAAFFFLAALVEPGAAQQIAADPSGPQTYEYVCGGCHQPTGLGVPGAFPPLAGHVPALLAQVGRDYLPKVALFGLSGPITVEGKTFDGAMPGWSQLSDGELASALNYVANAWGNDKALPSGFTPFTAEEIAKARSLMASPEQTHAQRLAAIGGGGAALAERPSIGPTFTAEQAERGQVAYRRNCQDCHGANLDDGEFGGAPLKGGYFRQHWGSGSVTALFSYTKAKMPPDRPGGLSDQTYADIVAFFLSLNGYKPGDKELPSSPDEQQKMSLKP